MLELCWELEAPAVTGQEPIQVSAGRSDRDGPCHADHAEACSYLVLPEGSCAGITVDPIKGATCAVAAARIGSTDRRAYMVRCTGAIDDQGGSIAAVHYRDAAGVARVSHP